MKPLIDHALVLERHPYMETSAVVSVLTRRHGLIRLLARGLQRPKSRFFALLDFFDELELEWAPAKRSELAHLKSGSMSVRRRGITRDLRRYTAATSLLELAKLGSRPGQVETDLFMLLSTALTELDAGELSADEIRVRFQLEFLRQHGLSPALERCAACGGEAPPTPGSRPRVGFSAGAGGRLCAPCAAEARASGRRVGTLPLDVLVTAARMLAGESRITTPERLVRVRDFVERFLDYHLEARPRSHRLFLAEDNRNAPHLPVPMGD
jgi:DNA repair protein RecO (recombination protein O)